MDITGSTAFTLKDYIQVHLTAFPKITINYLNIGLMVSGLSGYTIWKELPFSRQIRNVFILSIGSLILFKGIEIIKALLYYKKHPEILGKNTFVIDEEGITISRKEGEIVLLFIWEQFQEIVSRKTYFLFRINRQKWIILPKRMFDPYTQQNILSFAKGKIDVVDQSLFL